MKRIIFVGALTLVLSFVAVTMSHAQTATPTTAPTTTQPTAAPNTGFGF